MARNTVHIHADDTGLIVADRYGDKGGCIVSFDSDNFLYLSAEAEEALRAKLNERTKVLRFPTRPFRLMEADNIRAPARESIENTLAMLAQVGSDPSNPAA